MQSYEKHARAPSFSSHDSSSSEPAHTRRRIVPDPVILGAHDAPPVPPGGLSELELKGWAQAVAQDAEARLAQTVLSRTPMGDVLEDRAATIADAMGECFGCDVRALQARLQKRGGAGLRS